MYLYCTVHYCTRNKKTVSFSLKFEYFKGMFEKWNAYPFSVNFLPILLVLVAPRWNLPGSAWSITDYCNVQCTVLLITYGLLLNLLLNFVLLITITVMQEEIAGWTVLDPLWRDQYTSMFCYVIDSKNEDRSDIRLTAAISMAAF